LIDKFFLFDQLCSSVLPFIVQNNSGRGKADQKHRKSRHCIVGSQSLQESKNHLEERGKENAYNGVSGKTD
jgi:hypothetical protein